MATTRRSNSVEDSSGKGCMAFVLIFIIITICYSNTLDASWHFDDYPNIVDNANIHLTDISVDSFISALYYPGTTDRLYRPLSCLSFAINWYFGADHVAGYHFVNILCHIFTAFFLFLSVFHLLKAPNIKPQMNNNKCYSVALLTAVLWALHPVQTQAVTYIVQRMTVFAALFYVIGILSFLKARRSATKRNRFFYYGITCTVYVFALMSKENAVVLPGSLILLEFIFFNRHSRHSFENIRQFFSLKRLMIWVFAIVVIFLVSAGLTDNFHFIFEGYNFRPFNLSERLITEPRVLLKYFFQLFYPSPFNLSIQHDITISRSLFNPMITLPAILIHLLLIILSYIYHKRFPLLSYALLFFYVNNLVESTFIPLELMFDHRNYLPSLFIFLPISAGLVQLIEYSSIKSRVIHFLLFFSIIFVIISMGTGTFIRNHAWSTEKTIWEDAHGKYPYLARPYQKLAEYHKKRGDYKLAFTLYQTALHLKSPLPADNKFISYNNMGNICNLTDQYEQALLFYKMALSARPDKEEGLVNIANVCIKIGDWKKADNIINKLLNKHPSASNLNLKGFVALKRGDLNNAVYFLKKASAIAPENKNSLINLGCTFMLCAEYQKANSVLLKAYALHPLDINILLCLAETNARAGEVEAAKKYVKILFRNFTITAIESAVESYAHSNTMPSVLMVKTNWLIKRNLEEYAAKLSNLNL